VADTGTKAVDSSTTHSVHDQSTGTYKSDRDTRSRVFHEPHSEQRLFSAIAAYSTSCPHHDDTGRKRAIEWNQHRLVFGCE
jgi:hypothetical protein